MRRHGDHVIFHHDNATGLPRLADMMLTAFEPDYLKENKMRCLALLMLILPGLASAQQTFRASDLHVDGIYATRAGDPTLYCLLGGNACMIRMPPNPWNQDPFIGNWLTAHPQATALAISSRNWAFPNSRDPSRGVYLWIQDADDSLNVALVREGRYPAGIMQDHLEVDRQQADVFKDPKFAASRAFVEQERAKIPEDLRPHRLVTDIVYSQKMREVSIAEAEAQHQKKGFWSGGGIKGRSPPRDDYLIEQFQQHRNWFDRIQSLQAENPKLTAVNRDPKTSASARASGVPQKTIDEYVDLLVKMDANEQLVNVLGTGQLCLTVADILYGLFDNGIIKGYVFSPVNPQPLVQDLEHWPPEMEATTAYKLIGDNWYLFEVHH